MPQDPLIDPQTLAAQLDDPRCVIVDCRFDLGAPEAGAAAYRRGHIPGARYAHLDRDLSRPPAASEGRHPLPTRETFAARLGEWGIDNASLVVAYDDAGGAVAARLWWMLHWLGHADVRVLDGGFRAWEAAGLPTETAVPKVARAQFMPMRNDGAGVVTTGDLEALQMRGHILLDARAAPRFRGEQEPLDPVAGHVPGARNWPFTNSLDANGRFRDRGSLAAELRAVLADRAPEEVIAMCGSGVTACHLLLAMAAAGLPPGRLYAGSWSEWIRDPRRPIARGSGRAEAQN